MFEIEPDKVRRNRSVRLDETGDGASAVPQGTKQHRLDDPTSIKLHSQLLNYYTSELEKQYENRLEMATDADFYDNIQWTQEQAQALIERGQVPLVFNVLATTVDWVLGTEKRSRADFKILPRRKEDAVPAQRKTELIKYLSDVNKTKFSLSRSFEDAAKVGIGWIEDGIQSDDEGEPLYSKYASWRDIIYDSAATELSLDDARYIFRAKWLDVDIAKAIFKERAGVLDTSHEFGERSSLIDAYGDDFMDAQESLTQDIIIGADHQSNGTDGYSRPRVRVIEGWFRVPVMEKKIKGGMFAGEIFDPYSEGHLEEVNNQNAEIVTKPVMRMHVAIFTSSGLLWLSRSPYRHNRFPFTPIWNKRRDRDNQPYGLIRNIRDLQADVNKRASKALHILSTNKIIMEDGAVDDVDELRDEVAQPDAVIVRKKGYELTLNADRELSQYQLELMSRNINMIQQVGGVTDENLGRSTNAVSGRAIIARQEQGALATALLFDNYRLAQQCRGEKLLSNVEQFMSEEKQFRITNMRGKPEYVTVNDGLPENSIVRAKADFIIDEQDHRATMRQAQLESLFDLLTKIAPVNPQFAVTIMDLVIESMDVTNREEIVKRIRQITGMKDPDADQDEPPTPEEQARAQVQQMQQQIMVEDALSKIKKTNADAARSEAQALEIQAKTIRTNVAAQSEAISAASAIAANMPGTADIGDHILHEAGFQSRTELEQHAQQQQQAEAQALAQQQQQPQDPAQAQDPAQSQPAQADAQANQQNAIGLG